MELFYLMFDVVGNHNPLINPFENAVNSFLIKLKHFYFNQISIVGLPPSIEKETLISSRAHANLPLYSCRFILYKRKR
jgi:hypothetical protein